MILKSKLLGTINSFTIQQNRNMENNQSSPETNFSDYKIADLSLSDLGRRKIGIAEGEMRLMALRRTGTKSSSRGKDYGFIAHDG